MNVFITWFLPPLLGGIIGYITNALAVKMLFRPLEPKRIFGVHIPFTPGILPRERHTLAESLGDVVSNDLLTEDVLRSRLESEELRGGLKKAIRSTLDGFLDTPVSSIRISTSKADPLLSEAVDRAYRSLSSGEPFRQAAAAAVRAALSAAESLRVGDLLAPEGRSLLSEWFREPGRPELASERMRGAVYASLEKAAAAGKSFCDIFPLESLPDAAGAALDTAYPGIVAAVRSFLEREDVRKELERYGGSIVRRAVARLSPLQRLFVSAAQYEKAILESMPATVSDLAESVVAFLSQDRMRERLRSLLLENLRQALCAPLSSHPEKHLLSVSRLSDLAKNAVLALGERVAQGKFVVALNPEGTLGDLLDSLGPEAREGAAKAVGNWLAGLFAPRTGAGVVGAFASTFPNALMEGLGETPAGIALGWDEGLRDRLSGVLAEKGAQLAARESSKILQSLDLRRIVVEKIDGLDMLAIEGIMLRVMSKELSGITWLGGVLGMIIGALQLVLRLIKP